jgi:cellulose synthase (UDP-forming)
MLARAGLTVSAWTWFLQPSHWTSPVTLAINIALLSVEVLFLPLWFFLWIWRMKRPNPALGVPELPTAMVVTKAPSEPWPMVRATLEAMLAQDFPFPYDTWLVDESPPPETRRWCAERGIQISTREGVAAYDRPTWPRRTCCKEGNLAYSYDMWGYDLYDVVAQLDADHVPTPDYLRHMLVPSATRSWGTWLPPASATATPAGRGRPADGCTQKRSCMDPLRPATAADTHRAASAPTTRCARQRCRRSAASGPSWPRTSPPP